MDAALSLARDAVAAARARAGVGPAVRAARIPAAPFAPLSDDDPLADRERAGRTAVCGSCRRSPAAHATPLRSDLVVRGARGRGQALDRRGDLCRPDRRQRGPPDRRSGGALRRLRRPDDRRPDRERVAGTAAAQHLLSAGAAEGARLAFGEGSARGRGRALPRSDRVRRGIASSSPPSPSKTKRWSRGRCSSTKCRARGLSTVARSEPAGRRRSLVHRRLGGAPRSGRSAATASAEFHGSVGPQADRDPGR